MTLHSLLRPALHPLQKEYALSKAVPPHEAALTPLALALSKGRDAAFVDLFLSSPKVDVLATPVRFRVILVPFCIASSRAHAAAAALTHSCVPLQQRGFTLLHSLALVKDGAFFPGRADAIVKKISAALWASSSLLRFVSMKQEEATAGFVEEILREARRALPPVFPSFLNST